MNIDAKIEEVKFNDNAEIATSQVVVECDIPTMGRGGLNKILTVTGDAVTEKVEIFDSTVKVYGKVTYRVLYVDGENKLASSEYCSDFAKDVNVDGIEEDSRVTANLLLQDIDSMAKGGDIRLQAVVDISLTSNRERITNAITDVNGALGNTQDTETSVHIASICENIDISEEYRTGANIEKILLVYSSVSIDNVKPNKDSIIVNGDASATIVYMSDGKVFNKNIIFPYSDEINVLGVDKTSVACIKADIVSSKIIIDGIIDDNVMKICLTVNFHGEIYDYDCVKLVDDVYSPTHLLSLERENIEYSKCIPLKTIRERIQGEVAIEEDNTAIEKIIATETMPNVMTNCIVGKDEVKIDSLIAVEVAYLGDNKEWNVLKMEVPSSIIVPCDMVKDNDNVSAKVVVLSCTSRIKHEREVEVSLEVAIMLTANRKMTTSIVTAIEDAGDRVNEHKSMSIYFVSPADTMWDIVKNTGVSREEIMAANAEVDFDNIKGGERIVVFRKPIAE